MTPKEKAEELLWKFNPNGVYWDVDHVWIGSEKAPQIIKKGIAMSCKRPLLIAIDEMMKVYASACVAMGMSKEDAEKQESKYLIEVKTEIEKL